MYSTPVNSTQAAGCVTASIKIEHPELWTLQLGIHLHSIDYMMFCKKEDNSMIYGSILLSESSTSRLKSIENAIYDNPVLLQPYGEVRVMIDSNHYVLMPESVAADDDTAMCVMESTYPDDREWEFAPMGATGAYIGFASPAEGLLPFIRRTFANPLITHPLAPLCRYAHLRLEDLSMPRMVANLQGDSVQVCAFSNRELVLACEYQVRSNEDAIYYIMHAWQSLGMDGQSHELQLAGDKAMRTAITTPLRKYINYVMPIIFPAAALKLGPDAMRAPLNLILLALCE